MASTATTVAMALVVLAAVSSDVLHVADADAGLIASTCKKTKNPATCVAMLSADRRSAIAITVHGLANTALLIAIDTVYNNTAAIIDLYQNQEGTPEGGALAVCNDAYLEADNDLELQARLALDYLNYAGASRVILLAKGAGDACENAFKAINKKSPLTDMDRQMTERCGVTADLMDLLASK
ncbi:Pectinesterase inhibitor [Hordeum vulgare]|nr:Pectinesterase inhibitor [Hordeum vulgare]